MARVKARPIEIPVVTEPLFDEQAEAIPDDKVALFEPDIEPEAITPLAEIVDVPEVPDLAEEDRKKLVDALRAEIPVDERARLLATLARFKDTKRAPVGLRAIQTINELTGIVKAKESGTPPMFMLPDNTSVSVKIEKVEK